MVFLLLIGISSPLSSRTIFEKSSLQENRKDIPVSHHERNGTDLIAQWHFDEGEGNIAHDSSENGNDGQIHGASWHYGTSMDGLKFDGIDDRVGLPQGDNILEMTEAYTITSMIISSGSTSHFQSIISLNYFSINSERGNGLTFGINKDGYPGAQVFLGDDADGEYYLLLGNTLLVEDGIYHIALRCENSNLSLFINGLLDGSMEISNSPIMFSFDYPRGTGDYNSIGMQHHQNGNNYGAFRGVLNRIDVYNRALTGKEIEEDYNGSTTIPPTQWHFEEGEGNIVHDSSENGHDGVLHNFEGGNWVDGVKGKALKFDGVDDYIDFSPPESFYFNDEFTVGAWIKRASKEKYHAIIGRINTTSNKGWNFVFRKDPDPQAPNSLYFNYYDDTGTRHLYETGSRTENVDSWQYIALSFKAGHFTKIYINGAEDYGHWRLGDGSRPVGDWNTVPLRIGDDMTPAGTQYFNGVMDEFTIHNRALSTQEIADNYKQNSPNITEGPILTDITYNSATVSWITNRPADSEVEYGQSREYDLKVQNAERVTEHSITLTDLQPGTNYHFRVGSIDILGNMTVYSGDNTFETREPEKARILWGPVAVIINETEVNIRWCTEREANSIVEYGTMELDEMIGYNDLVTEHNITITGLIPNTTYRFRVGSKDSHGNGSTYSPIDNFTTPARFLPFSIENITITYVDNTTAVITWNTDKPTNTVFEYGNHSGPPLNITVLDEVLVHNVTVTGLDPDATYHFQAGFTGDEGSPALYPAKGSFWTRLSDVTKDEGTGEEGTGNDTGKSGLPRWAAVPIVLGILAIVVLIFFFLRRPKRKKGLDKKGIDRFGRVLPGDE